MSKQMSNRERATYRAKEQTSTTKQASEQWNRRPRRRAGEHATNRAVNGQVLLMTSARFPFRTEYRMITRYYLCFEFREF